MRINDKYILAICSALLAIFAGTFYLGKWAGSRQSMENANPAQAAYVYVFGPDLDSDPQYQIRQKDGVEPLAEGEDNLTIDKISPGRYGYAYLSSVDAYVNSKNPLQLDSEPVFTKFEVHYTKEKKVVVIFYMPKMDALRLRQFNSGTFSAANLPFDGSELVAIETTKISDFQEQSNKISGQNVQTVNIKLKP